MSDEDPFEKARRQMHDQVQRALSDSARTRAIMSGSAVQAGQFRELQLDVYRNAIRSEPKYDFSMLQSVVDGLREIASDIFGKSGSHEIERVAMEMLCHGINAGAFSGPDWLLWRTQLIQKPTTMNAWVLLRHRQFKGMTELVSMTPAYTGQHLEDIAKEIEKFIVPTAPAKQKRKPGRPKNSFKTDPVIDAKIYTDWKASDASISEFCRRRGLDEADVRDAVGRHKKRLPRKN
jgi:hypothetical protein